MKNFFIVGIYTMLSRILGLVREMFLSHVLGASIISDAFIVAIKLPNFFRRFCAEGALNSSFVPSFTKVHTELGAKKANFFLNQIFTIMIFFLTAFVIWGECNLEFLLDLIAPGFNESNFELTFSFARITFPYILFISLASLFNGALNSIGKFGQATLSQSILNIILIFVFIYGVLFDVSGEKIGYLLCYGFIGAGIFQYLWVYFALKINGFKFKLIKQPFCQRSKNVMQKMIPGIIGASATQLSILVDTIMASTLSVGSISFLYYADRLYQLPLALFGTTLSVVLLPRLSKMWAQKKIASVQKIQMNFLYAAFFFTFPACIGLFILSTPIVDFCYGHGKFNAYHIHATSMALCYLSVGLPAHVASKVSNAIFFANENTKTPLYISLFSVLCNIILNFIFISTLKHQGLALATAFSGWINLLISFFILHKKKLFLFHAKFFIQILKLFIPSLTAVLNIYFFNLLHQKNCISQSSYILFSVFFSASFIGLIFYKTDYKKIKN